MKNQKQYQFAAIVGLLSTCLLAGCGDTPRQEAEQKRAQSVQSETQYGDGRLQTVEHDGHLVIVEGRYSKGAMMHHPDCPCLSTNTKEL